MTTSGLLNNRYQILQTLAQGGFGKTFLAEDTHLPSKRKCVIKQLKPALESLVKEQWVKDRFKQEAAILEKIGQGHPQIPDLYAYFSENENFYLVQEWVEGETLREFLATKGKLAEEQVQFILVHLLPVLDYIHSHHIIHRDIKPDNIILRAKDSLPVLIDFGAVKEALNNSRFNNTNSSVSFIIGTPGYMPSEQATGRPLYSSDLYSLALTCVYLLTGKSPEKLEVDSQTGEILWRKELPHIHSSLGSVLERAIRFHPRDRFVTAKEMLRALPLEIPTVTQATLLVAPRKKIPQPTTQPTGLTKSPTIVLNPHKPEPQENSHLKLLLPLVLLGGVGLGGLMIGFSLFTHNPQTIPVVSTPTTEPIPDSTIIESPQEDNPPIAQETPPEENNGDEQTTGNSPPFDEQQPPENTQTETNTPSLPNNNQESPQPNKPNKPQDKPVKLNDLPIFPLGTKERKIATNLGEPTWKRKGYRNNTTAWSYSDYISQQVDISYTFDDNTNKVLQTEVAFAQSVDLKIMQKTLNELLAGNTPETLKEALQQIYNRQTDLRSFTVGNFKGMIQRNQKNQIYIGVWDAQFH